MCIVTSIRSGFRSDFVLVCLVVFFGLGRSLGGAWVPFLLPVPAFGIEQGVDKIVGHGRKIGSAALGVAVGVQDALAHPCGFRLQSSDYLGSHRLVPCPQFVHPEIEITCESWRKSTGNKARMCKAPKIPDNRRFWPFLASEPCLKPFGILKKLGPNMAIIG
ncbi:hypothetical protein [Psychromarinibacter halotolerans]|uniref:Secreted protein n=1 Tax=Psychromarinibacter halotolerans TaxID=1775175 RepID=A0ABV7GMW4_9RHOB|nr:hypothetical protein [Psychromarinibacter halotolerans]MDF0595979.1 hypothetical protein [Psychromarinibacter halotolerans]